MSVDIRREDGVAYVGLNNPPVNAIGLGIRQGLKDALDWISTQEGLSHIILHGSERAFAAGADASEFDSDPVAPHLPDIIQAIEACKIPWVAAVSGVALGGGCELVLACRYRIAKTASKLGFPEVNLGVVPGAGGTQRLPRLIGMKAALELISTGKPISAETAKAIGLIDEVCDDPLAKAAALDITTLHNLMPVSEMPAPVSDAEAVSKYRDHALNKMRNHTAPQRAIDLIEMAASKPFSQAILSEREVFLELRKSNEARALRHIFFAERSARAPAGLGEGPAELDHVAVVGGGMMGTGIAYACLHAGLTVFLLEADADGVERAHINLDRIIENSLKRGFISEAGAADRRSRFQASTDYASAASASLAIEAAFEDMQVKTSIVRKLEQHLPKEAILATNTSYLDIDEIAAALQDTARLVGLHFFAPAHIMKLLEIVKGKKTSDKAIATGFALAKLLQKIPVLSGVCDGFIGNRILARYREAADTVFLEGSSPWEIDEAMVDFGYPMGPYEAQDLSGLDIAHANRRRQDATRDPNRRYIPIADRMIELGKLGKKTSAGWYRYPGGGGKVEDPIVADLGIEEAHFAGVTRCDYSASDIQHRLLLAMINEAADILYEGIAASAADIDIVTVSGYGFPRMRGGLMHYADHIGPAAIFADLQLLAAEDPIVWKPSPLIEACVASGLSFAEYSSRK